MLINFLFSNPLLFVVLVSALFMSLSLHEFAHGFVAFKLGDPTAKSAGRLTVNPLAHMDPIGTMLLLFAGFGWARPVPVNPMFLKNIRRDMAIISFAGPISNFILAGLSALILNVISYAFMSNKFHKHSQNGINYTWISYNHIIKELPILGKYDKNGKFNPLSKSMMYRKVTNICK